MKELIELQVNNIAVSREGGYSLLLTDREEKTVLPIVIGPFEAQAIALPLEGTSTPRPLTHDLIVSFCETFQLNVKQMVITDIREDTYYAEIQVEKEGELYRLDSRPSDAVALALRFDVPIYMATGLIEFTVDYEDLFTDSDDS